MKGKRWTEATRENWRIGENDLNNSHGSKKKKKKEETEMLEQFAVTRLTGLTV